MAKYRGKHERKTKGKYVKAMLRIKPRGEVKWQREYERINNYLADEGIEIGSETALTHWNNTGLYFSSFHLNGASIYLKGVEFGEERKKVLYKPGCPDSKYRIDLVIGSNNDIEHIIEKMEKDLSITFEHLDASGHL